MMYSVHECAVYVDISKIKAKIEIETKCGIDVRKKIEYRN